MNHHHQALMPRNPSLLSKCMRLVIVVVDSLLLIPLPFKPIWSFIGVLSSMPNTNRGGNSDPSFYISLGIQKTSLGIVCAPLMNYFAFTLAPCPLRTPPCLSLLVHEEPCMAASFYRLCCSMPRQLQSASFVATNFVSNLPPMSLCS